VVSSTPRPHFTPGKDPVPILQEAGWAPGPVWTCGKSRPHGDSIPDRPARSYSLNRLSYRAHKKKLLLLTAIGLSPVGSSYFTCIQNMKLVTTEFKSGGLHEKHVVATGNVGNRLNVCL